MSKFTSVLVSIVTVGAIAIPSLASAQYGGGNGPVNFGVGPSVVAGGGSVLGASVGPSGSNINNVLTETYPIWSRQCGFLTPTTCQRLIELYNNGGFPAKPVMALNNSVGTVAGASKFLFTTNLKRGMQNPDVTELQNRLITEGLLSGTPATGYFGPLTFKAAKAYQAAHKIDPTSGFVGPLTRAELNK